MCHPKSELARYKSISFQFVQESVDAIVDLEHLGVTGASSNVEIASSSAKVREVN